MSFDEQGRICFDPGETLVLHVSSWEKARVRIQPRNRKGFVFMNAIRLRVDEIDGVAGEYEYLVTSEKLALQLMPILESGAFSGRSLVLSAEGEGFRRQYAFHSMPRGESVTPPTPASA